MLIKKKEVIREGRGEKNFGLPLTNNKKG